MKQTTPKDLAKKRAEEQLLVSEMIALYCRRQHSTPKGSLCPECQELCDYALARIDHCPFMETKTFCSACKVHCYKPAMREQIRTVMRWAGPRMLPVHPRSLHPACDRDHPGQTQSRGREVTGV